MSGYIAEDIIEQVRAASDIAEIVGAYVTLKRRGRSLLGLCPFHQEKTPSFTVSQEKQFYHCFGCGKGGNVFSFLMEHERMTFPEAVRFLAQKSGIRIPESHTATAERSEFEKLYFAHTVALEYYRANLHAPAFCSVRQGYLRDNRRISDTAAEYFSLGVSGDSWRGLFDYATKKGVESQVLVKSGLVSYNESRREYYDRFRERLMIPIQNLSDKVIGFGGRTLRNDEQAKYVNSPETPLYSKGHVLYGLNLNRSAIREAGFVIIVEGYFDLISLWQIGVTNVVASSGTAFTAEQGRLLSRFTDKAHLFFDADSAGVKAAIRSVDSLFNAGIDVRVITAPAGEDPDTLSRGGADIIQTHISKAERYLQFRFREYRASTLGPIERARIVKELQEIAARITDASARKIFVDEAADILGVDQSLVTPSVPTTERAAAKRDEDDWGARGMKTIEAEFISFLLSHPQLIGHAAEHVTRENITTPRLAELYANMVASYDRTGGLPAAAFVGELSDDFTRQTATFLMTRQWQGDTPGDTLQDYIDRILLTNAYRPPLEALKARLRDAEKSGDHETANQLFAEIRALQARETGFHKQ